MLNYINIVMCFINIFGSR